jgi:hypothetical protein
MIVVREAKDGTLEPITGNPVLLSLDGKEKAPLQTVLALSWSAEDRARFGIYIAEPFTFEDGTRAASAPRYEKQGGAVVQLIEVEDVPTPEPEPSLELKLSTIGITLDELREALKR